MNNKYIKKSVDIEAIQWNGTNLSEIQEFGKDNLDINICTNGNASPLVTIEIKTLEGVMKLNENDYLIKGIKGEYYPCKPDIFELTYEKVYTLEEVIKEWEEKGFEVENNSEYTLKNITLQVYKKEENNTVENQINAVNKIEIQIANNINNTTNSNKENTSISSKEKKDLKAYLSNMYSLKKENININ